MTDKNIIEELARLPDQRPVHLTWVADHKRCDEAWVTAGELRAALAGHANYAPAPEVSTQTVFGRTGIHYHITERTGGPGWSVDTQKPCSKCDWGHPPPSDIAAIIALGELIMGAAREALAGDSTKLQALHKEMKA